MRRPACGNQLLAQHAGRAGEQEEKPPPARITPEKAEEIRTTALAVYKALGCSCFARVDMFLTPAGEIYFNEVNTIPGFTSHSRYPDMLKAAGFTFEETVNALLAMGDSSGF